MRGLGKLSVWVGVVVLVVGGVSRFTYEPIWGIQAHAFLGLAQACFLFAIATTLVWSER